ncbi:hypothetical protein J2772_004481 [Chryseobacterium jejuense]|nr:hypothetical protein [Chryseobacterium jejuense]
MTSASPEVFYYLGTHIKGLDSVFSGLKALDLFFDIVQQAKKTNSVKFNHSIF